MAVLAICAASQRQRRARAMRRRIWSALESVMAARVHPAGVSAKKPFTSPAGTGLLVGCVPKSFLRR